MDIYKFIENLKKYLKATFNYEVSNNAIRIYLDIRIPFPLYANWIKSQSWKPAIYPRTMQLSIQSVCLVS